MPDFYTQLKQYGKVKIEEPMSKYTTFKIGGKVDFLVVVKEIETFVDLIAFLNGIGRNFFVLGGGSNMLVKDDGFRGVAIKIEDSRLKIQEDVVEAAAGVLTASAARESVAQGLVGFEWGVGVPGTIGGAVRGNAGAMGLEMVNHVYEVDVFRDGEVITLTNEDCAFGYRDSVFKHNQDVILCVRLKLEKGDKQEAAKKMMECIQYRSGTQPKGFASTGCIFKNVECRMQNAELKNKNIPKEFLDKGVIPAGWLVENVGMKGVKVGDAEVSERHGNFIINLGKATASDVLALIEQVKEKVYTTYGIELEEEIQII